MSTLQLQQVLTPVPCIPFLPSPKHAAAQITLVDEPDVHDGHFTLEYADSLASMLAGQFNAHIFVPAVLASPFYNMATGPFVDNSVVVRTVGLIACILNLSAGIAAFMMRARLFYLRRRGRAYLFAEDYYALIEQRKFFFIHSSMFLICSAMLSFLAEFLGYAYLSSFPVPGATPVPYHTWERVLICFVAGGCAVYLVGVCQNTLSLGRSRQTAPAELTGSEKV